METTIIELRAILRAEREKFQQQQAVLLEAEREVELSRERYASLYDYSPVAYATLDAHGFVREANLTLAQMLGKDRGHLAGTLFSRFLVPDDRRILLQHLRRCRLAEPAERIISELRVKNRSGCLHVRLLSMAAPAACTSTAHQRFHTTVLDVSAQKLAEAAFQDFNAELGRRVTEQTEQITDAHRRLQAIVNTAVIGIMTLDERGLVESANDAALRMLGYSRPELLGSDINRHLVPQTVLDPAVASFLPAIGAAAHASPHEVAGRRKDGTTVILEASLADFRHADRFHHVVTLNDITGRKRLERELISAADAEGQRIGRDLHDGLGQHLHAMYYMGDLLRQDLRAVSPGGARDAATLARHMEAAIEMTRGLARGLQPVSPVRDGLMKALEDLAERSRKMYRLDFRFECATPVLMRDNLAGSHLFRIAQEAVNNAVKHGKASRVSLRLARAGQGIILSITDNGRGIVAKPPPAYGLGLRTMRYRAEALGGSLVVRPAVPSGTEVVCAIREAETISPT